MPLNAFIVRPFGFKPLLTATSETLARLDKIRKAGKANLGDLLRFLDDKEGERPGESKTDPAGGTRAPSGPGFRVEINFDYVDRRLITPALENLNIKGETAAAVVVAGNIREDMFHRLLTADLVIADVSVHNPNVFYELGIRQAFRDRYTFILHSNLSEYPFDLRTDRYFAFDVLELLDKPENAVRRLTEAIRGTISSEKADSPVFKLLPKLEAEDRSRFIAVPTEFREEVDRARSYQRPEYLRLLAVEVHDFLWEVEGLREIGRAQFDSNYIQGAKVTWLEIVNRYPDDIEANTVLSTVYERMDEPTRSEQALARVSRAGVLTPARRSELRALNGRNLRAEWVKRWQRHRDLAGKQKGALTCPLLQSAYDAYEDAFSADLNNTYAGLNALSLLIIQVELAGKHGEEWRKIQSDPSDAANELNRRRARIAQLVAALKLAVEADRRRLDREGAADRWFNLQQAAVECILSRQPERVAQLYRAAIHFAPIRAEQSIQRALNVYRDLDIGGVGADAESPVGTIRQNVEKAFEVLTAERADEETKSEGERIVMFIGLRIDEAVRRESSNGDDDADRPDRAKPNQKRIGLPQECVAEAKKLIREALEKEHKDCDGKIAFGMAGGANGGDLLFHETCAELKVKRRMCLALPPAQFTGRYVATAGQDWVERFRNVYRKLRHENQGYTDGIVGTAVPVFADTEDLPRWLHGKRNYNVGRRNNLWMLQHAIVEATRIGEHCDITLLAMWDGGGDHEMGGIGHVVDQAKLAGVKVVQIVPPKRPGSEGKSVGPAGGKGPGGGPSAGPGTSPDAKAA